MIHRTKIFAIASLFGFAVSGCTTTTKPPTRPLGPGEVAFQETVKPLFEKRCVWCHGKRKTVAGLNFQDREGALNPDLKFIVPGDPEQSRVYQAITLDNAHPRVMPGDGWGITTQQREAIKAWIEAGAPWPEGKEGRIRKKPYQVDHEDYL